MIQALKKRLLKISLVLLIGWGAAPIFAENSIPSPSIPREDWIMNRYFIPRTCGENCIEAIHSKLSKHEGVKEIRISRFWGEMAITHNINKISIDNIRKIIRQVSSQSLPQPTLSSSKFAEAENN